MASPFSGTKVHWTFVLIRFTPLAPLQYRHDVQGRTNAVSAGRTRAASAQRKAQNCLSSHGSPFTAYGSRTWLDRRGENINGKICKSGAGSIY